MTDPDWSTASGIPDPTAEDQPITISQEVLNVGTEWIEAGRIRLRRRIVTETRTVEITVRREELHIQVHHVDQENGLLTGNDRHGPVTDAPGPRQPLVIVLHEEIPIVRVRRQPYEQVTVDINLVERTGTITTSLRREEVAINTTTSSSLRPRPGHRA